MVSNHDLLRMISPNILFTYIYIYIYLYIIIFVSSVWLAFPTIMASELQFIFGE